MNQTGKTTEIRQQSTKIRQRSFLSGLFISTKESFRPASAGTIFRGRNRSIQGVEVLHVLRFSAKTADLT